MNNNKENKNSLATSGVHTMPQRKYPRANFHNYNGGVYFVTICTKNKIHYFGEIYDNIMHLSELGRILHDNLTVVNQHYSDVTIPLFVVMPNHFHAIIDIMGDDNDDRLGSNLGRLNKLARISVATGGDPAVITHHNCRLGNVISGIKAHVTRYARRNNIEFGWQPRYHDHIIRGEHDGYNIAEYIENNVARWDADCFNK